MIELTHACTCRLSGKLPCLFVVVVVVIVVVVVVIVVVAVDIDVVADQMCVNAGKKDHKL